MLFVKILPAHSSGITRISALPAAGSVTPLWRAACKETALSSPSGPPTMQPGSSPFRHACFSAAASTVLGILGFTTSTALTTATFGHSQPSLCAKRTAFSTIFFFCCTSGAMLMAQSVIWNMRPSFVHSTKVDWLKSPPCGSRPMCLSSTACI